MLMIKSGMATSLPDVVPLGIGVVWGVNGFGVVDVREPETSIVLYGGKEVVWLHLTPDLQENRFRRSACSTTTPPAPLALVCIRYQ